MVKTAFNYVQYSGFNLIFTRANSGRTVIEIKCSLCSNKESKEYIGESFIKIRPVVSEISPYKQTHNCTNKRNFFIRVFGEETPIYICSMYSGGQNKQNSQIYICPKISHWLVQSSYCST